MKTFIVIGLLFLTSCLNSQYERAKKDTELMNAIMIIVSNEIAAQKEK